MWLGMILFWGGLIWFGVWLVRRTDRNPPGQPVDQGPRRILEDRFARGEIDEEELERRSKVLAGLPPCGMVGWLRITGGERKRPIGGYRVLGGVAAVRDGSAA